MQTLTPGANTLLPGDDAILSLNYSLNRGSLDITAYLLDEKTGKVRGDADMLFYGQLHTPNHAVVLEAQPGQSVVRVNTRDLEATVGKIAVCATIDGADNLSELQQLSMQLDSGGQATAQAQESQKNRSEAALILAEIYRYQGKWKCRWVMQGFNGGLQALAEHFGVEIAAACPEPPVKQPKSGAIPAPRVNLQKITLDKHNTSISLEKKSGTAFGRISVNLNWNQGPQKQGFLARLTGGGGIDLDLGAMVRLRNGNIDLVQALGNTFGHLNTPPFIKLQGDDRTGASRDGEWLYINGKHWQDIEQVVIYCFIYDGVPNWAATDGMVKIDVPEQPPIEVRMTEGSNRLGMCAVAELRNQHGNIQIQRVMKYFSGHKALDKHFGFGFSWTTGRK